MKANRWRVCWFVLCLLTQALGLAATPDAELRLAPPFTDHMVLQRDHPVPIWGETIPGSILEVRFAGQVVTTKAGTNGQWHLSLGAMPANAQDGELVVRSTAPDGTIRSRRIKDVLVGEVWIAAGQSNMEWPLEQDQFAATALADSDVVTLRLFNFDFATKYVFGTPFTPEQVARLHPTQFFSGRWQRSSPAAAGPFSAIAYYFGRELHRELGVPVGVINLAVGGSPTEAWIRLGALEGHETLQYLLAGNWLTNQLLGPWCRERGQQNVGASTGVTVPGDLLGPNHAFKPGFLWASGMARLHPFTMRGVLWYQGESNAQESWRVAQHEQLFPLLVSDWRDQWQREFPFLFCQLSAISTNKGYQAQFWPLFRDSQRRLLGRITNAAMIVTSDLGHPTDVHPRNKRDVARRLTRAALGLAYGGAGEISGPLFDTASVRGDQVIVRFKHARGLTTLDGQPPQGFEWAGANLQFQPGTATIVADEVRLTCPGITLPAVVRYGWMPYPDPPLNVGNAAGLPASTFSGQISASPTPRN